MKRRAILLAFGLAVLGACGSAAQSPDAPTSSSGSAAAPTTGPVGGNGTVYTSSWGSVLTITGHPITEDGSLGPGTELLSQEASDADFAALIDGLGATALTANLTNYWSTELLLHTDGQVVSEVAAPDWCGGEGLTYAVCTLLDDTRVARTTALGRDPVLGAGPEEGSILVSSLRDGSTLAEFGPFDELSMVLGSASADELLLVTTPPGSLDGPSGPGSVLRLDLTDATTTEIGESPTGWIPLCPTGSDSVLGYTLADAPAADGTQISSLVVVGEGSAAMADLTWSDEEAVGCSADGRFLYLQQTPLPPTGTVDDRDPPNTSGVLERVTLADGSRDQALVLDQGTLAGPVTR